MRIDFVSDIACPWCAIGLASLELALERIGSDIPIELHFQPFELNPDMAAEGADAGQYLQAKYGMSDAQLEQSRQALRERAAAVGLTFGARSRVWNTFDAHRLIHWAGEAGPPGAVRALKRALLQAYHGEDRNPGDPAVLAAAAREAGLDDAQALQVLHSGRHADDVRERERRWQSLGIHSVPSIVIDERHLIQGGQPPEVFERALRQLAAGAPAAPA